MRIIAHFLYNWATQVQANTVRFLSRLQPFSIPVIKIRKMLLCPHFICVERKTVSNQLSWHRLPYSECLSLLDSAVTIGSVHTFWCLFCPFGHITTPSVFDVSISTWFHVKPVYSSYIFNDKKPKTSAGGWFPCVHFWKPGNKTVPAFPGTVHSQ